MHPASTRVLPQHCTSVVVQNTFSEALFNILHRQLLVPEVLTWNAASWVHRNYWPVFDSLKDDNEKTFIGDLLEGSSFPKNIRHLEY